MYNEIVDTSKWIKFVWLLLALVGMTNAAFLCYSGLFFELGIVTTMAGVVFMFTIDDLHDVTCATPHDHVWDRKVIPRS